MSNTDRYHDSWGRLRGRTKEIINATGIRDRSSYTEYYDTSSGLFSERITRITSEELELADRSAISFELFTIRPIILGRWVTDRLIERSPQFLTAKHKVFEGNTEYHHTSRTSVGRYAEPNEFRDYTTLLEAAESAITLKTRL